MRRHTECLGHPLPRRQLEYSAALEVAQRQAGWILGDPGGQVAERVHQGGIDLVGQLRAMPGHPLTGTVVKVDEELPVDGPVGRDRAESPQISGRRLSEKIGAPIFSLSWYRGRTMECPKR